MLVTMKGTESINFVVLICKPRTCNLPLGEIWLCVTSILLLRSNLSIRPCLSICEQKETSKPNRVVIIIFVDYKLFFSLEVSPRPQQIRSCNQPQCTSSNLSWLFVSVQPGQTLCQDVKGTEYGEESAVCIYIINAFSFLLKYID